MKMIVIILDAFETILVSSTSIIEKRMHFAPCGLVHSLDADVGVES